MNLFKMFQNRYKLILILKKKKNPQIIINNTKYYGKTHDQLNTIHETHFLVFYFFPLFGVF